MITILTEFFASMSSLQLHASRDVLSSGGAFVDACLFAVVSRLCMLVGLWYWKDLIEVRAFILAIHVQAQCPATTCRLNFSALLFNPVSLLFLSNFFFVAHFNKLLRVVAPSADIRLPTV